jgi:hypothetical protein
VFSKRKLYLLKGTVWRTTINQKISRFSSCLTLWLWHHCLPFWALLSVSKGLAISVLPWILDFWSSRQKISVKMASSRFKNIQFCCQICCSSYVMIRKFLMYDDRSLSVGVDIRPLFLFADAFRRFVHAHITLETVALDTQKHQLNSHEPSVLFQNRTSLPFSDSFTRTVTQHND